MVRSACADVNLASLLHLGEAGLACSVRAAMQISGQDAKDAPPPAERYKRKVVPRTFGKCRGGGGRLAVGRPDEAQILTKSTICPAT
jgi:hypothetical protein